MIHLPASVRVYLATSPCDMRRSFDGLHALVTAVMQLDAFAGHLFVFSKRRRDRVKILLGSRRVRGLGQAAGGGNVRDAVRLPPGSGSGDENQARPRGRRPLPSHLKRERIEHDLREIAPAATRTCAPWAKSRASATNTFPHSCW